MGTHPIFESDFDCLTEWTETARTIAIVPRGPRSTETTEHLILGTDAIMASNRVGHLSHRLTSTVAPITATARIMRAASPIVSTLAVDWSTVAWSNCPPLPTARRRTTLTRGRADTTTDLSFQRCLNYAHSFAKCATVRMNCSSAATFNEMATIFSRP